MSEKDRRLKTRAKKTMREKTYPRSRESDTIEDLDKNGMLGSEGWKKPGEFRKRKHKKSS